MRRIEGINDQGHASRKWLRELSGVCDGHDRARFHHSNGAGGLLLEVVAPARVVDGRGDDCLLGRVAQAGVDPVEGGGEESPTW